MKRCIKCGGEKGLEEFGKNRTQKDGLHYYCKSCMRAVRRVADRVCRHCDSPFTQKIGGGRPALCPDCIETGLKWCSTGGHAVPGNLYVRGGKACKSCQKSDQLTRRYGITAAIARELRDQPCMVCGTADQQGRGVHPIDHDHETGAVRGVLCHHCNTGLGHFRDSPELLARAIHYLTRGADYRAVDQD